MRRGLAVAALLALGLAVPVAAQDSPSNEGRDEQPARPRRTLRVVQNPYDLASFYRSRATDLGVNTPTCSHRWIAPVAMSLIRSFGLRTPSTTRTSITTPT